MRRAPDELGEHGPETLCEPETLGELVLLR